MVKAFEKRIEANLDDAYTVNHETGCHEWRHGLCKGYGALRWRGKVRRAYRVFYEIANGPIPDGLHILHKCDNKLCVNPDHLYAGTHIDNMADTRGKPGRRSDPGVGNSKLTLEKVEKIRSRLECGENQKEIGADYGVTQAAVSDIKHRKTWNRV